LLWDPGEAGSEKGDRFMKRRPASPRLREARIPAARAPARASELGFLFDLDGTLVDSVYEHTLAWRNALRPEGINVPAWQVHRRIGMSGRLLVQAILSEMGFPLGPEAIERVEQSHAREYERITGQLRPLPGAKALLAHLTRLAVPWIVATSARSAVARRTMDTLGRAGAGLTITRDDVERAKPDPDLFLAAARRLGVPIAGALVVGDSIWDILAARRAGAHGVGLLTGGTSREELECAGALRVYEDPSGLLRHLHELGVRPPWVPETESAPPPLRS
jgi:HAD superfamily hydrolase (TIGR01509 family)